VSIKPKSMKTIRLEPIIPNHSKKLWTAEPKANSLFSPKAVTYLVPLACLLFHTGCKHPISMAPPGFMITSGFMVTPKLVPRDGKGDYSDQDVKKLLNEEFNLYEVEYQGNSNVISEIDLPGLTLQARRRPFLSFHGKRSFAASTEADWAYPALVSIKAQAKYVYLQELELKKEDPQFELAYIVNPVELLKYQLLAENRFKRVVLFQRFICAPDTAVTFKLQEAQAAIDLAQLVSSTALESLSEQTDLSKRFVLRKYHKLEAVAGLIREPTDMFELATDASNLSNGAKSVDADHLKFRFENKIYRLSDRYRFHLKNEGVRFDCSELAEKKPTKRPSKRKLTILPTIGPRFW
jgi:hypothetical protein